MNEALVAMGIVLCSLSGVPGLFAGRHGGAGQRTAAVLMVAAAVFGSAGAVRALILPPGSAGLDIAWHVPGAAFRLQIDAISAMFLIQIFVVSALGSIYGLGYWRQTDHPENARKLRLFYGLMTAGMALLVTARNAILFLAGWEGMALAAFMAVTTEDHEKRVRVAGYVYLVATRIGTLCLFGLFGLLYVARGSLDIGGPLEARSPLGTAIFLVGFVGFGLKAGMMPLHVWLPGAHANAPSHVSALMSGVLIKMGIYGVVRFTSLFPYPPLWWGGMVLGFGIVSGVLGVAFAIGQHDVKRLLAYHSVENIGIIYIGIGLALLGRAAGQTELVALGLAGGLLHVWNHGLFKALLFLAAGSVIHGTGTREIDHLGGLLRRMPRTALAFLVGATAICGLPPLNGFVSELLIYVGLLRPNASVTGGLWLAFALSAAALALIGGLAVACFVKVFGAIFLGEARSAAALSAHESPRSMTVPMALLAAACVFIGMGAPLVAPWLDAATKAWAPDLAGSLARVATLSPLVRITALNTALLVALLLSGVWLALRIRSAPARVGTWDCGYIAPTPRMQYTSSSFAQMLVGMFAWALRPITHRPSSLVLFPPPESFHSHVPDTVLDRFMLPAGRMAGRGMRWFRWVQRGSVHAYIAYVLAALVGLLVWQRGF